MRPPLIASLMLLTASACLADDAAPTHWSLRPVMRPDVPRFAGPAARAWVRNPVDAYVRARLDREGLAPAPEADARTLIRRVTFDLTGLPPTVEEIDAFREEATARPQAAYEHLIDRLLASPHYGEKWGRHWLDVVRYAETEGFEYDRHRPGAWRYRDYVIDRFNADKPFDRFVQEQLAGDELGDDHELLVASGFQRLGPVRRNAGNQELAFSRHEVLNEMTDAVGAAFLGMTVGCARCHDHKFDRFTQEDYFGLQAHFAAAHERDVVLAGPLVRWAWEARAEGVKAEIKRVEKELEESGGAAKERLRGRLHELQKQLPEPLPAISTVRDDGTKRTAVHVLKRGDEEKKERLVGPRVPSAFAAAVRELPPDAERPRLALARWVASRDNPLTARVLANRVWAWHFGKGIVATANDFGVNGSRPTHPELLDSLASELVASGWRLKPLHRQILLSSTYRQAAAVTENDLLAGFPVRRLGAEEVRDAMLAVSGRLNPKTGGPSIVPPVESDLVTLLYNPAQWAVTADPREHDRRSVYLIAKRNLRLPFLEVFDQPDAQTSCGRRASSTHALQALELLNGRAANDLAASFADRLRRGAGSDPAAQVERAFLLAVGRPPTAAEKARAVRFLRTQPLSEFALAVFNLNAFLYVK
jgi:hypothetical protein